MSGRVHHKGLHHNPHPSTAASDAAGWVECISALNDQHPATALLLGSPPLAGQSAGAATANGARPGSSSGGDAGAGGADKSPHARAPAGVAAMMAGGANSSSEGGKGMSPAASPAGAVMASGGSKLTPQQEFDASLDHAVDVMLTEVRCGVGADVPQRVRQVCHFASDQHALAPRFLLRRQPLGTVTHQHPACGHSNVYPLTCTLLLVFVSTCAPAGVCCWRDDAGGWCPPWLGPQAPHC